MLYMTRVDTLDNATLDIELSNGHLILFSMERLLEENPAYTALQERVPLPRPINEGRSLRWKNGPVLSLEEILTLLATQAEQEKR